MVGAYASSRATEQLQVIRRLMSRVSVVDYSEADAVRAAHLGAAFQAQSQDIGAFDTLIAGQALNRGWTIVTTNTKHFNRVPDLDVVDWSAPWMPPREV